MGAHTSLHDGRKEMVAELRQLAATEDSFAANAPALLAYAERAGVGGGASLLLVPREQLQDSERAAFFSRWGFCEPSAKEEASLPSSLRERVLLKLLDTAAEEEASDAIAAYAEEQRMWGGL